jgi:hypothetical protein
VSRGFEDIEIIVTVVEHHLVEESLFLLGLDIILQFLDVKVAHSALQFP